MLSIESWLTAIVLYLINWLCNCKKMPTDNFINEFHPCLMSCYLLDLLRHTYTFLQGTTLLDSL